MIERAVRKEVRDLTRSYGASRAVSAAVSGTAGQGVRALRTMYGRGDYSENVNSLVIGGKALKAPSFGQTGRIDVDSVQFSHRNNFDSVVVPLNGDFAVQSYLVNASNSALFPMLARYAEMYEKVRFKSLIFDFESHTSPFNTTSAMGTVMMGFLSNPAESDYLTENEFLNSSDSVSGRPDKNLVYGVECKASKWLYTQNDFLETTNAIGNYAMGKLQVGTFVGPGYTAGAVLGRLRAAYTVECSGVRLRPSVVVPGTEIGTFFQINTDVHTNYPNATYTDQANSSTDGLNGIYSDPVITGVCTDFTFGSLAAGRYRLVFPTTALTKGDRIKITCQFRDFPLWLTDTVAMASKIRCGILYSGPIAGVEFEETVNSGEMVVSGCDTAQSQMYSNTASGQTCICVVTGVYDGTDRGAGKIEFYSPALTDFGDTSTGTVFTHVKIFTNGGIL